MIAVGAGGDVGWVPLPTLPRSDLTHSIMLLIQALHSMPGALLGPQFAQTHSPTRWRIARGFFD